MLKNKELELKTNYDKILMETIEEIKKTNEKKTLLLHTCCGPCSTSVIERLLPYFDITVFYYNPNIEPENEYIKRKNEQIRFLNELNKDVKFLDCDYENEEFHKISKGLEDVPEGGYRCHKCFKLRLSKTAMVAKSKNFDYFGTTLTVSPHKNSEVINLLGKELENQYNVKYLLSDFKKQDGYKKSIELSKKYNLYRQNYCGCLYSKEM